ncbi:hypothetical protein DL93DRAFT_600433 [Clavulina sp. PMI_390]|nr:hypothetical protein DL93DRAFT_600433 [Clavulina sp. PMI_390]
MEETTDEAYQPLISRFWSPQGAYTLALRLSIGMYLRRLFNLFVKARPVSNAPAPPILIYTPPTPVRSNTDGEEQSVGTPDRTSDEVPVLDIQKAPRVWRIRIERAEFTGLALPQDSRSSSPF